jgi:hypothetical protein
MFLVGLTLLGWAVVWVLLDAKKRGKGTYDYMKRVLPIVLLMLGFVACGKDSGTGGSPTGPSTPTQTRTIRLEANLEFGDVAVGSRADRILRIYNEGNTALSVTALMVPAGGAYTATWIEGTIAPGASQAITVYFSPTEARNYSGTLSVNGNHTGGTNTTPISGRGMSATPAPAPTPQSAISGVVREEGTTIVIGGATVVVKDTSFSTSTDASGRYGIAGVPNGNYVLRATANGYQLTERTVSVNGSVSADISMRKPSTPTPTPSPTPTPPPPSTCTTVCTKGKACGNTCISKDDTCHTPPGSACNALTRASTMELDYTPVPPVLPTASTSYSDTEAIRKTR